MEKEHEKFIRLFQAVAGDYPGAERFLSWLEATDFFSAPASTKFHMSTPGGLVLHSINVAEAAAAMCHWYGMEELATSAAMCGLVHDICKVGVYKPTTRRVRTEDGKTPDFVIEYVTGTVEAVEVKSHFKRTAQRDYIYRRRLFIELIARPRGWVFTEYIEKEK